MCYRDQSLNLTTQEKSWIWILFSDIRFLQSNILNMKYRNLNEFQQVMEELL